MRVLAIDSSTSVAAIAIAENDHLIYEIYLNRDKTHSQKLMSMVESALTHAELTLQDIDVFGVAHGPGSFTGLRIGVAAIKAFCHTTGKPAVAVNTLDALGFNIPYFSGIVCPIMDARREQVYTATYIWKNGCLMRQSEYMVLHIQEYMKFLEQKQGPILFVGDGVPLYGVQFQKYLGDRVLLAPFTCRMQQASSIAFLTLQDVQKGKVTDYNFLAPFYLRKPQAEREYEMRMEK